MTNPNYLTPAERLKYIRSLIKLGREELASALAIPAGTIRKWETGERTITSESITRCIEAYGSIGIVVTKKWLLDGEGYGPVLKEVSDLKSAINNKQQAYDYLKSKDNYFNTFFSYLDEEEKFQFVSSKYNQIFDIPTHMIIGKTLKSLIGDKSYNLQKAFLRKAYSGDEILFEYPWEYNGTVRYLKLHYIPDINLDGKVKGIFSFLEEQKKGTNKVTELKLSTSPDIDEILPYVEDTKPEYNRDLHFGILETVKSALDSYRINYDYEIINKIANNIYLYSVQKDGVIPNLYLEKIIKVGLKSHVLTCINEV